MGNLYHIFIKEVISINKKFILIKYYVMFLALGMGLQENYLINGQVGIQMMEWIFILYN